MRKDPTRTPHSKIMAFATSRMAVAAAAGLTLVTPAVLAAAPAQAATVTVTSHFVYTTSTANTSGDSAFIVNGATNGQPGDLLFVTPQYNPGAICGCVYEPAALGVWYDTSNSEWAAFREDSAAMPAGEAFNVLAVPKSSSSVFVQTATSSNIAGDFTLINSTLTNSKPKAVLQVTQNWNPGGAGGVYNPHNVGVFYDTAAKKWAIFNEDLVAMTTGASFNVLVGSAASNGGKTSVLTTTSSNTTGDTTLISNSQTTGNPNNVTFVTQDWNPGGVGGTYNNNQMGVWYTGTQEGAFNGSGSAAVLNSAYNLLVYPS